MTEDHSKCGIMAPPHRHNYGFEPVGTDTETRNYCFKKQPVAGCGTKFGIDFCSDWCNVKNIWPGCGTNTLSASDPRNTDNTDYTCSCAACNGCDSSNTGSPPVHDTKKLSTASTITTNTGCNELKCSVPMPPKGAKFFAVSCKFSGEKEGFNWNEPSIAHVGSRIQSCKYVIRYDPLYRQVYATLPAASVMLNGYIAALTTKDQQISQEAAQVPGILKQSGVPAWSS